MTLLRIGHGDSAWLDTADACGVLVGEGPFSVERQHHVAHPMQGRTVSYNLLDKSYDTWYGAIDSLFCIVGT